MGRAPDNREAQRGRGVGRAPENRGQPLPYALPYLYGGRRLGQGFQLATTPTPSAQGPALNVPSYMELLGVPPEQQGPGINIPPYRMPSYLELMGVPRSQQGQALRFPSYLETLGVPPSEQNAGSLPSGWEDFANRFGYGGAPGGRPKRGPGNIRPRERGQITARPYQLVEPTAPPQAYDYGAPAYTPQFPYDSGAGGQDFGGYGGGGGGGFGPRAPAEVPPWFYGLINWRF